MATATEIFSSLEGMWQITRTIKPGGHFSGTSIFTAAGKGSLIYREKGVLTLDTGEKTQAFKSYLYRLNGEGRILVYFADGESAGELFHALEFINESRAGAEHSCGKDFYKSAYKFILPTRFEITHEVSGPRKAYKSVSVFRRD